MSQPSLTQSIAELYPLLRAIDWAETHPGPEAFRALRKQALDFQRQQARALAAANRQLEEIAASQSRIVEVQR